MERGSSIWNIFFEECGEQLVELAAALQRLEAGTHTPDCLDIAFRAVHSIKGGGGIFGLGLIVSFADVFETALGLWRDGRLTAEPAMLALFGQAAATLTALVAAARDNMPAPASDDLAAQLAALASHALTKQEASPPPAPANPPQLAVMPASPALWRITFSPHDASARVAHEVSLLLGELAGFGTLAVMAGQQPVDPLAEISPKLCTALWSVTFQANCNEAALQDVFAFTDDDWNINITRTALNETPLIAPAPQSKQGRDRMNFVKHNASGGSMSEANNNDAHSRKMMSFRIGVQEFCVDIMDVREIRGWSGTTRLPNTPDYVRGVVNLRGAVVPIVDLAVRLGLPKPEPTARNVIIVTQMMDRKIGMLVDAVSDILTLDETAIQPMPDIAGENVKLFVRGILPLGDRMISILILDHILPAAELEAA
jgi:purine-binding chemotaxis protein CheW